VREAFRTRDMRALLGTIGLGHVRYATKGTASSEEEAQPFYVNAPYGIVLVHNGNLTNTRELTDELFRKDRRHLNTSSDTELLVNVLANELQASIGGLELDPAQVFQAVSRVHERVEGSYASIALIAGYGLLAFRDPFGIRPSSSARARTRTAATSGSSRPSRSCWRTAASRSSATSSRVRPCSSTSRATCTRSSARRIRSSCPARSSTCTSPVPTRS
jgi:glutamine phosphoribosylpyrophosphate amidotransferase